MNTASSPAVQRNGTYEPPRAPLSYEAMVLASKRRAIELRRQDLDAALSSAGHFVLRTLRICEEASARAVRRWTLQG